MGEIASSLEAIVAECAAGRISPAVALMKMLIETEDESLVEAALAAAAPRSEAARAIVALKEANGAGCARVASMLRSDADSPPQNASVEEGVAFCKRLFDWSVRQSEEASVALYSLGNPALLATATREIVAVLEGWGSFDANTHALDVGCGIGRMEEALSPEVAEIRAIDVSEAMVSVARRRCAALSNVAIATCSGLDLAGFDDATFDLVFAIDTFPYLVQSGVPLVATHFAEAARVLRGSGEFVILDFSYRDDVDADRRDVAALASAHGFEVLVNGEAPFSMWNGTAFRMRKWAGGRAAVTDRTDAGNARSIARRR